MDFRVVIGRISRRLVQDGYSEVEAGEAFGPADSQDLECLTDLYATFGHNNAAYSVEEMADLKHLRVPPKVVEFYRLFDPKSLPVFECNVGLMGLPVIRDWNASAEPSVFLVRFGILAFASTTGGHSVCLDLNHLNGDEPRVILVDQSFCYFDERSRVVEWGGLPQDVYEEYRSSGRSCDLSYELIARCCPEVAPTFSEFLQKLADKEYEDVEAFLK